jgi:hypothetical protein
MLELVFEQLQRTFGPGVETALEAIAEQMAEAENLWVPYAPLRRRFPDEIPQLLSNELVRRDASGMELGLAHQTLFEFIRGRALAFGQSSLYDEVCKNRIASRSARSFGVRWHTREPPIGEPMSAS